MDGREGGHQSRAAGLTRAILDTFPVIKFGRNEGATSTSDPSVDTPVVHSKEMPGGESDLESARIIPAKRVSAHKEGEEYEMAASPQSAHDIAVIGNQPSSPTNRRASSSREVSVGSSPPMTRPPGLSTSPKPDPTPEMIGTEICPICITEFEDGDDLRVLPCDGKHRFHRDCVDPWLLQVSSVCPLCREGECWTF